MINWTNLFRHLGQNIIEGFAKGEVGYRDLERSAKYTPVAGEVRRLLRNRKLNGARILARKACKQRGL